jgi:Aromatic-ring-opening dioxygenase LigAB, LigA subunit
VGAVSDELLHYRFPPASAYRLNRCLFALKSDDDFRARFLKDARAAMRELALGDDDAAAVLQGDRDTLLARGAHPYLVFMAGLRLKMAREPVTFEYF